MKNEPRPNSNINVEQLTRNPCQFVRNLGGPRAPYRGILNGLVTRGRGTEPPAHPEKACNLAGETSGCIRSQRQEAKA